ILCRRAVGAETFYVWLVDLSGYDCGSLFRIAFCFDAFRKNITALFRRFPCLYGGDYLVAFRSLIRVLIFVMKKAASGMKRLFDYLFGKACRCLDLRSLLVR